MVKAAIYARVSTDEQADKGYSLETQVMACQDYANRNSIEVIQIYKEDFSGTNLERPEFVKLQDEIRSGGVGIVILYSLDRLSRDHIDLLVLVREWLRSGIELYGLDVGKIEDELSILVMIKGWQSADEVRKIRERTTRGRRAKARSGKYVGSGTPPYGYKREGIKDIVELVVHEKEAKIVKRIFDQYTGSNGESRIALRRMVKELTAEGISPPGKGEGWYPETVGRIIRSSTYKGELIYKDYVIPVPAIIEPDLWEAAQHQRVKNKVEAKRNRKREYLLSGMIKCSCGIRMIGHAMQGGKYLYYGCGSKTYKKHLAECKTKNVRADLADWLVWDWIKELLTDEDRLKKGLRMVAEKREREQEPKRKRLTELKTHKRNTERKLENLTNELGEFEGKATAKRAIREGIENTSDQFDTINAQIESLRSDLYISEEVAIDPEVIKEFAGSIKTRLENPTFSQKRELLRIVEFEAKLREDDSGRWLEVKAGIQVGADYIQLDKPKIKSRSNSSKGRNLLSDNVTPLLKRMSR